MRGAVDGGTRLPREELRGPAPDPAAVGEEAEQDEDREHRAGRDVADGRPEREGARPQQLGLRLDEFPSLREQVVDLLRGQPQRPVDEVLPELVHRGDRAGLQARPLARHLPGHQSQNRLPMTTIAPTALTTIASHFGNRWRSIQEKMGQSRAVTRIDTSSGHHEQLELDDEPDPETEHRRDDEDAPAVRGRDAQPPGHGLAGIAS